MKKIKVLHTVPSLLNAGTEQLLYGIVTRINKDIFRFTIACMRGVGDKDQHLKFNKSGIKTYVFQKMNNPLVRIYRIYKFLKANKFDIIHIHNYDEDVAFIRLSAILAKIPLIFTYDHSVRNDTKLEKISWKFLNRFTYANIVVSEAVKKHRLNCCGGYFEKIIKVTNGIDLNYFNFNRKENKDYGKVSVGVVGRFVDCKRFDLFIKTATFFKDKNNIDFILVGDGKLKSKLMKLTKDVGVNSKVHFLGWKNDMKQIYKIMDIMVAVSTRKEGFGLNCIEAMASGVPIIAVDNTTYKEVITQKCGIFVKPNANEIANAIKELILSRNNLKKEKIIERARNRVEIKFNIEKTAKQIEMLYFDAIMEKKNKKIGLFNKHFPAFTTVFITNEAEWLNKQGFDITTFSVYPFKDKCVHKIAERWVVKTVYIKSVRSMIELVFAHLYYFLRLPKIYLKIISRINENGGIGCVLRAVYFAWVVKKKKIEHIHVYFAGDATYVSLVVNKLTGIPFSCTLIHQDLYLSPPKNMKNVIEKSEFCVTISNYNKNYIIDKFKVSPEKIKVIYHSIDVDKFLNTKKVYKNNGRINILSVCRLMPVKNVPFLIYLCKKLKGKEYSFECNIIGDGPERNKVKCLIKKYDLDDCIKLRGEISQEDIVSFYKDTKIFINTSISEGMPITIMEAMASGLPVVAPRIQGIPELVHNGRTGYLFEPGNLNEAFQFLEKLINNPDLREKMGKNSKIEVSKKCRAEKNVCELAKILNKDGSFL